MATTTTEYEIADHDPDTGRLLLAGGGHWLVVDLIADRPIRMTRATTETEARTIFQENTNG